MYNKQQIIDEITDTEKQLSQLEIDFQKKCKKLTPLISTENIIIIIYSVLVFCVLCSFFKSSPIDTIISFFRDNTFIEAVILTISLCFFCSAGGSILYIVIDMIENQTFSSSRQKNTSILNRHSEEYNEQKRELTNKLNDLKTKLYYINIDDSTKL